MLSNFKQKVPKNCNVKLQCRKLGKVSSKHFEIKKKCCYKYSLNFTLILTKFVVDFLTLKTV